MAGVVGSMNVQTAQAQSNYSAGAILLCLRPSNCSSLIKLLTRASRVNMAGVVGLMNVQTAQAQSNYSAGAISLCLMDDRTCT